MTRVLKFTVVGLATVLNLLVALWILIVISGGMGAGFSDRTVTQIGVFLIFGLGFPSIASILFATLAIKSVRREKLGSASAWLFAAMLPIPLLYFAFYEGFYF